MKIKTTIFTAAIFLAVSTIWLGCEPTNNDFGEAPSYGIFVATSDFTAGAVAVIHGDPPAEVDKPDSLLSGDPAASYYNGLVYVVNRWGFDNIQVLDPEANYETVSQYSTGNGSNPQDIAFASTDRAFISRYEKTHLYIVDSFTGYFQANVNLGEYADADGIPEAAKMLVVDNRLFVALQRLDSANFYAPTEMKGLIVVIDTATGDVVNTVELASKNPVTDLIYDAGTSKIYLGCAGGYKSWGYLDNDGGIESISINTTTDTYTADGALFDEDDLGGDVNAIAMVSSTQAYALVSDDAFNNYLLRFNPSDAGEGLTQIWETASWIIDIAIDSNGYLYVADRDFTLPGVRVWDTDTDTQLTDVPLDVGLPPYDLAVME